MVLSILLLTVGIVVSLLGFKLFRVLLPIVGLVAGTMVGFIGFQGVFGTGAVSTTVAVFVALAVGVVLAVLSFMFFELAILVYMALLGATAFGYLGLALGLENNGFVLFLMSVAGFILGLAIASNMFFSTSLIVAATSMLGVSMILASIFLLVGNVSVDQLSQTGIVKTVLSVVDQSFLWFFVWVGGTLFTMQLQYKTLVLEILDNNYEFQAPKATK